MKMSSSETWFHDHFESAADEVIAFFGGDGIALEDQKVVDIGCGDGIIDLGVALKARPELLAGFDIEPRAEPLAELARRKGVAEALPPCLEFHRSEPRSIPADENTFDLAFSWSTFEHVEEPVPLLREVHRIIKPTGVLMVQIWPLYYSQHGSHLWDWFPSGFAQHLMDAHEVEERVATSSLDRSWTEDRLKDFRTSNKITLDGLQAALVAADFVVAKLELITAPVHIPPAIARFPLSLLGISGVKLLAIPA